MENVDFLCEAQRPDEEERQKQSECLSPFRAGVEAGIHTVGEAAWQHCTRLLMVHLPSSLLCLKKELPMLFCSTQCIDFGCWAFEECHALA